MALRSLLLVSHGDRCASSGVCSKLKDGGYVVGRCLSALHREGIAIKTPPCLSSQRGSPAAELLPVPRGPEHMLGSEQVDKEGRTGAVYAICLLTSLTVLERFHRRGQYLCVLLCQKELMPSGPVPEIILTACLARASPLSSGEVAGCCLFHLVPYLSIVKKKSSF